MALIERADRLPDAAILPDRAAALLLGISVWTLRWNNPVPPVQITARMRGRKLSDIHQLTATKQSSAYLKTHSRQFHQVLVELIYRFIPPKSFPIQGSCGGVIN